MMREMIYMYPCGDIVTCYIYLMFCVKIATHALHSSSGSNVHLPVGQVRRSTTTGEVFFGVV